MEIIRTNRKRNRKILFLTMVLWGWTFAGGVFGQQFDPPLRIELPAATNTQPYHIRFANEKGFILSSISTEKENTSALLQHYDTNLTLTVNRNIPLPKGVSMVRQRFDGGYFYAVYQLRAEVKSNQANTYIILYSLKRKKIDVFSFAQPNHTAIEDIYYYGNCFLFTRIDGKEERSSFIFSVSDLTTRPFEENINPNTSLESFFRDTLRNCLWAVSKEGKNVRETRFCLLRIDTAGRVHERYPFDVGSEKKLLNCAIAATGKRLILFGAYAGADGEPTTRDGQSGVYCLAFDGERFLPYSFFPFSSLRSDVSFSKRSSNIHAYAYFLAQNDSLLLFATDFYSPEYAYPSQPDYSMLSFYGVPGYTTQARFIGYRYTVGCLFTCNAEGEIIRNNYFNYNGLILKSVTELLQAYIDPDSADVLVYFSTAGKLYSLIFTNDRIIQNIQTQTIEPLGQYQVVSANELSACRHWYKNYFTCYGYQTVSNRVRSSRKSDRRVFYVNKLVFD